MKNKNQKNFSKNAWFFLVILMLLSLFLAVGTQYIFPGCTGKMKDGNFMRCHWAQNAIILVASMNALLCLISVIIKDSKIRIGMMISSIIMDIIAIMLASNIVIRLCMNKDMHCWSSMKPMVTLISIIHIILAIIICVILAKKGEKINNVE